MLKIDGACVFFGKYEQGNGIEPIEWQILEQKDGKALLISKYILDSVVFSKKWVPVNWEKSYIREWLNGEFMEKAFDDEEKAMILETECPDHGNPKIKAALGEATKDKVFLLSIPEALEYIKNDADRKGHATGFAEAKGLDKVDGICCWWLRTNGLDGYSAAGIRHDGSIRYYGNSVDNEDNSGVRPALWVSL